MLSASCRKLAMGKVKATTSSWRRTRTHSMSLKMTTVCVGAFALAFCVLGVGGAVKIQQDGSAVGGSIENLTAEAISIDHSLQLRIKWAAVNIKDTQFYLEIKPFKDVEHCTSNKPCYEYNLDPMSSQVLVPRDPMATLDPENRECTLELGCRYDIQLESNNYKYSKKIVYQVAECVDGDCLCAHRAALPSVGISYQLETASELRLIWNVSQPQEHLLPAGVYVDKVAISLGRQTNPSLKWGGSPEPVYDRMQSLVSDDGNATVNYPVGQVKIDRRLIEGSKYIVKMTAVDNYGCHGPEGSLTISTPMPSTRTPHTQTSDTFHLWQIPVIVSVLAFLTILGLLFGRYRYMRGLNAAKDPNWQGVYHHIPSNKRIQHISMHENTMYVDKDIWDARGRGEADHLEVPHSCLKIGREIGKGAFGRVFIARAEGIKGYQVVAVKQLKKKPSSDEIDEFISEITTMKTVAPHPNVVSLLGCCTIRQPFLMIMEYVGCGDLLHYLRQVRSKHEARLTTLHGFSSSQQHSSCSSDVFGSTQIISEQHPVLPAPMNHHGPKGKYLELHYTSSTSTSGSTYAADSAIFPPNLLRPSVTETQYTTLSKCPTAEGPLANTLECVVDHKELHNFATQIARGMKHLHKQHITHRDLAARNILIDENKTLKISDFGLSRNGIYVNTRNKKVPLRWLSLEAMRDSLYSAKSDVWAFGVVLWEIGTLGGFPYPTVSNEELLAYLLSGRRLQRPENCSEHLYELMLTCWAANADDRPEFAKIVSQLEPDHQKIYVDFNELRVDYVFPPIVEVSGQYRNVPAENASLTSSTTATESTAKR